MRYSVVGFGRSGSHWVGDLLSRISGLPLINDDIDSWRVRQSVLHTNDIDKILHTEFPCDGLLVFCIRKNSFDAIISLEVARYTNEWYQYSTDDFQPFCIDADLFVKNIRDHSRSQINSISTAEDKKIPHCVCIYEELVAARDRYRYVADTVGFTQSIDHRDVPENPNPRDYTKIVSNYAELKTIWRNSHV